MNTDLAPLRAEVWGQRFRRARHQNGMSIREAAEWISPYVQTSHATLGRLELEEDAPRGRGAQLAFVAMLVYGVNPADLGLSDLPECQALNATAILADLERRRLEALAARTDLSGVTVPELFQTRNGPGS